MSDPKRDRTTTERTSYESRTNYRGDSGGDRGRGGGGGDLDRGSESVYRPMMTSRNLIIQRTSYGGPGSLKGYGPGGGRSYSMERSSQYGGGGGLFGVPAGAYSSVTSTGVSNVRVTREQEKKDMQDLNERFASYIEKVRFLEAQNRKLADELEKLKAGWGKETSAVKAMFLAELDEARKLLDDNEREKGRLEVRVASLEEQLEEARIRGEDATRAAQDEREKVERQNQQLSDYEAEINLLRRRLESLDSDKEKDKKQILQLTDSLNRARMDLDNETLLHIDAENRRQTLEEQMEFMKSVHDQEMKELAALVYRDTTSENREFWKNEMGQALREIQQVYDDKIDNMRGELETFYNMKIQEFRTGATRQNIETTHSKEETKRIKTQVTEMYDKMSDLEARNGQLMRELDIMRREKEERERELESENGELKNALIKLRAEMEAIMQELQRLMDTKLGLELEIAAYRKLLESEENRLTYYSGEAGRAGGGGGGGGGGSASGKKPIAGGGSNLDRDGGRGATDRDRGATDRGVTDRDRGVTDRDRGVTDRDRGVTDRDRGTTDRDRSVTDRDRGLTDRDRGVTDRDRSTDRDRGTTDRDRGVTDRGVTDRDRGVTDRDRGVTDRDRGVTDRGVTDRDRGVTDRDRGVTDRDRSVTDRDRGVTDRDRGVTDRDRGVTDRDRGVTDRDRGVTDRDRGVTDRDRGSLDRDRPASYADRDRGVTDRDRGAAYPDRTTLDRNRGASERDLRGGGTATDRDRLGPSTRPVDRSTSLVEPGVTRRTEGRLRAEMGDLEEAPDGAGEPDLSPPAVPSFMVKGEVLPGKTSFQRSAKGPISISDTAADGKFISIENTGRKEEIISDWTLKRTVDDIEVEDYHFPPGFSIEPGAKIKIWAKGSKPLDASANDLEGIDVSWGIGSNVSTKLVNPAGEDRATHVQKTTFA